VRRRPGSGTPGRGSPELWRARRAACVPEKPAHGPPRPLPGEPHPEGCCCAYEGGEPLDLGKGRTLNVCALGGVFRDAW
jgi:hypothetical protein